MLHLGCSYITKCDLLDETFLHSVQKLVAEGVLHLHESLARVLAYTLALQTNYSRE